MVSYISKLATKTAPHFGRVNSSNLMSYIPNLAIWGAASTAGLFVFTAGWPTFQDTFYKKIPILGSYWEKEIPPEDRIN
ncbi:hypothetical protein HG536_0A04490 [Torulaspora globosa]|uniref:Cytochrome b-c1 complex subunit 10 n=1 Tax=Torulaspora globosa TaxID=48254 RepID=A0A7G3ZAU6_9SACH|nr:uncharacterized protein HG536_0A04490 [Torulaspora globosa]QLL30632.1 hypothetical protein HG536_0A04490 [Torulaspora globosa]